MSSSFIPNIMLLLRKPSTFEGRTPNFQRLSCTRPPTKTEKSSLRVLYQNPKDISMLVLLHWKNLQINSI